MAAEQEATRAQQILYDIYSQAEVAQHELVELQVSAPPTKPAWQSSSTSRTPATPASTAHGAQGRL